MPIKPRPNVRSSSNGVDVAESFISKGGSVGLSSPAVDPPTQEEEIQSLRLRVPNAVIVENRCPSEESATEDQQASLDTGSPLVLSRARRVRNQSNTTMIPFWYQYDAASL